ncbi:unnamed protein product [Didymodactylos carnosus]|uniref:Proteasome subunit beta n=1 Tax=Didymodactylos carnosus TaxID=1234261 RepID=A0A813ZYW8_9BILA|nr:unnamed protein product [Didymodactylos carnosus]CAF1184824.1 unnamed protein product [Didymodactylos carnosus]CAF3688180.1 unnamed protein product [Didymodactylos carnosus]CAF3996026.1 unnamed protein product [Didymodactylos carnosus]
MALASVWGYKSNDDFSRSIKCSKVDDGIDQLDEKLNIENISKFITLPPFSDPAKYLKMVNDNVDRVRIQFLKGTTTLAFKFRNGVIVAVDSRATAGGFIASGEVKKVIEINPYLLGTMAGGAADCAFWERVLARHCRYEMSTADAIDLGRRAIVHAAHRDAASGNIVRIYHMKETGWEKIEEEDTNNYMYRYRQDETMNF